MKAHHGDALALAGALLHSEKNIGRRVTAKIDDGLHPQIILIPTHPPRAGLVGPVERAGQLVPVREIGAQETVVNEPVVEPVFEGGGEGGHGNYGDSLLF